MITKEHIEQLATRALEGTALYVTRISIGSGNQIQVFIDGDQGVVIDDCVRLSRALEGALDREREDFGLDVSSHGAANPLLMPRQYHRHIGREFEIRTRQGEKLNGTLLKTDDNGIVLGYKTREPKAIGKGKVDVEKQVPVPFADIAEGRIKLKF